MSIDPSDISRFGPEARKQILEACAKKAATGADTAPGAKQSRRKYRNTPDTRRPSNGAVLRFDSKAEARRYDELMLLLKAGKIRNLKLQPQFTLTEAYTKPDGERVRALRYVADFSYERYARVQTMAGDIPLGEPWDQWTPIVEDVKSRATKTRMYEAKKKLMREKFGVEITEVEA